MKYEDAVPECAKEGGKMAGVESSRQNAFMHGK